MERKVRKGEREQERMDGWNFEHLHQVLVPIHVPDEETEAEREHAVAETGFKIQSDQKQTMLMNPMPLYLTGTQQLLRAGIQLLWK